MLIDSAFALNEDSSILCLAVCALSFETNEQTSMNFAKAVR